MQFVRWQPGWKIAERNQDNPTQMHCLDVMGTCDFEHRSAPCTASAEGFGTLFLFKGF